VKANRFAGLAFLFCLIFVSGAYAGGTYQRTEGHKKALIWNNDPKPGDTATWSGDSDANGYATGPGTLQWFRLERGFTTGSNILGRKRTPISSYSGTMQRGKLNGGVMTVDRGKTYHATFADGHLKGRWIAGPLITKAESVEATPATEKPERAESVTSTEVAIEATSTEKASEEKTKTRVAEKAKEDVPAEGPAEEKSEVSGQKSEVSKSTASEQQKPAAEKKVSQPLIAQASTEEPDQSAAPREPVNKKSALAPGAVRAIDRLTRTAAKKPEATRAKSTETEEKTEKPSKIAKPASSQPPEADTQVSEDIPAEGPEGNAQRPTPNAQPKQEVIQPPTNASATPVRLGPRTNPQPSSKETPVDDSIRTLTGPPKSLHVNAPPPPETNPPTQISTPPGEAVSSPPPPTGPKLTAVQAMDIADIEARTKGYDLGEYELPKAEYNAASDTWSVAYVARDAGKDAKKLSVTIQDKTGKAEVKK
jgi:hypothetical protein